MVNFSKVLKDLRKKEELTQKDLSIILSVSRSAIAQIENSNNNPSRDLMLKLLNLFDLNDDVRKQIEVNANGIETLSELDKVPVDLLKNKENTSYNNTYVWETYSKFLKNKQNILCLCILLKQNKYKFSVDERNKLLKIETAVSYLHQVVFGIIRFREHVFKNFIPDLRTSYDLIEDFTNALLPYYSNNYRDFRDLFYPREYKDDETDQSF